MMSVVPSDESFPVNIRGVTTTKTSFFSSFFNKAEQSRVMFYLDELLNNGVNGLKFSQADVGVISPYRKQVRCYE